jgi:hypothetical protein
LQYFHFFIIVFICKVLENSTIVSTCIIWFHYWDGVLLIDLPQVWTL